MPRSQRLKSYQFIDDLAETGGAVLTDGVALTPEQLQAAQATGSVQLTDAQAAGVMREIVRRFCHRNAKSVVYIPEAISVAKMERNARIWQDYQTGPKKFTPGRIEELAAEHDLTPQMVYQIVARERHRELREVQDELPGMPPAE